jgi:diguanylate cyclase (GGDEF)-like protein
MQIRSDAPAFSGSVSLEVAEIDEKELERALQKQALENFSAMQWVMLSPLAMLACGAFYIDRTAPLLGILGLQILVQMWMRHTARDVLKAISEGASIDKPVSRRADSVATSAAVWGLAMLPVAEQLAWGVAPMFVTLMITMTVGIAALLAGLTPRYLHAGVAGFTGAVLPQTIAYIDVVGPVPLIATLGYGPALIVIAQSLGRSARLSLKSQIENRLLAQHLQSALDTSQYLSSHDSLTGLLNRRAFEREAMALRSGQTTALPVAIILFDLDHFKLINDRHGHPVGDHVLRSAAKIVSFHIRACVAKGEFHASVARWGGEEFIIILGRGAEGQAPSIAEALRYALSSHIDPAWPVGVSVTASFGISQWASEEPLHEAISRADQAMYRAKVRGRNRVEVESVSAKKAEPQRKAGKVRTV